MPVVPLAARRMFAGTMLVIGPSACSLLIADELSNKPPEGNAGAPSTGAVSSASASTSAGASSTASSSNGGPTCTKPGGCAVPCQTGAQCATHFCVDGVCCDAACNTTCVACNLPGSLGTCTASPQFQPDNVPPGACANDHVCDGMGACRLANDQKCAMDGDCASDHCGMAPGKCQP
jgi:hypothetical protein